MFVRYVSHEIRTPLNTAFLGLTYLKECMNEQKLPTSFQELHDRDMLAAVDDIQSSCEVAVNILNDLLTYEKLEGGILQTQMKRIDAWQLVKDAVNQFKLQVSCRDTHFQCCHVINL